MSDRYHALTLQSDSEKRTLNDLAAALKNAPVPESEILANLGLFLTSKNLGRILFFYEIYKKIVNTHGIIIEFGVRWGQTLSLMTALRSIFEPFNRHRKIVGFDTFEGFKGVGSKDGLNSTAHDGDFSVEPGYENFLGGVLGIHESLNPLSHLRKYEIVKGDAVKTVPEYFRRHPETMISLAIFDFDIYEPTKVALEVAKSHLFKGSLLVFDELCDDVFPGETLALRDVFGSEHLAFKSFPMASRICYAEI
jgi:hypothetical protein